MINHSYTLAYFLTYLTNTVLSAASGFCVDKICAGRKSAPEEDNTIVFTALGVAVGIGALAGGIVTRNSMNQETTTQPS